MNAKIDEKILAKCSLRYIKGQADKLHECYITPTKLYFHRNKEEDVTALQDISNVKSTQMYNWIFVWFGLFILVVAWSNYEFGIFPEKDPILTTETPITMAATDTLNNDKDLLIPSEVLFSSDDRMKLEGEWQENNNILSFYIALAGCISLYYGFKRRAYLQVTADGKVILLRVYIITGEYENFYRVLLSKVGITNTSK